MLSSYYAIEEILIAMTEMEKETQRRLCAAAPAAVSGGPGDDDDDDDEDGHERGREAWDLPGWGY